jgi:mRNA-degrading endonuclease toxin of MazEF toxin-antitoxin module
MSTNPDNNPIRLDQYIIDLAEWMSRKIYKHTSTFKVDYKRKIVRQKEVYFCDFGINIGAEKQKQRPVVILSGGDVNKSSKVVVVSLTDAENKLRSDNGHPIKKSWILVKGIKPISIITNQTAYNNAPKYLFLDKDSVIQCEEINIVSKARLDWKKGKIGEMDDDQFNLIIDLINKNVFKIR